MEKICVDIGNSFIKVAKFDDFYVEKSYLSFATDDYNKFEQYLNKNKSYNIFISSVNKQIDEKLKKNNHKMHFLTYKDFASIENKYTTPHTLGLDRYCNIAFAVSCKENRASIIVDAGTYINFELVVDGVFYGGAIMEGINSMYKKMSSLVAFNVLPKIEVPQSSIGVDTCQNIKLGAYFATVGAIKEMCNCMQSEIGIACKKYITGGDCILLKDKLPNFTCDQLITLKGINEIAKK